MNLGIIGGGNMAQAIIAGVLRAGLLEPTHITVSEPDAALRDRIGKLGVRAIWDNATTACDCDVLLLAVKPQVLAAALAEVRSHVSPQRPLLISIAAGKSTTWIESQLPADARVARVMPNTPLMVGAGMSVLTPGRSATPDDLRTVHGIFAAGGQAIELPEALFDAVTAVSGSGPAYFFRLVELLQSAGERCGLPADAARQMATQTFIGAARLLAEEAVSPEELRRRVTSPGGTTAAALTSFDQDNWPEIIYRAVAAATQRGRELGASQ